MKAQSCWGAPGCPWKQLLARRAGQYASRSLLCLESWRAAGGDAKISEEAAGWQQADLHVLCSDETIEQELSACWKAASLGL